MTGVASLTAAEPPVEVVAEINDEGETVYYGFQATLRDADTVQQYQRNRGLMDGVIAQRELTYDRLFEELDEEQRREAEAAHAEAFNNFDRNRTSWQNLYGSDPDLDHLLRPDEATLYTVLQQGESSAEAILTSDGQQLLSVHEFERYADYTQFNADVSALQALRGEAVTLQNAINAAVGEERAELEAQFAEARDSLNARNAEMVEAYSYTLTRNYNLTITRAHLYVELTAEEVAQRGLLPEADEVDGDGNGADETGA